MRADVTSAGFVVVAPLALRVRALATTLHVGGSITRVGGIGQGRSASREMISSPLI
jgi:hypothetical protein